MLWRRGATTLLAVLLFVLVPSPGVAGATDISGTCARVLRNVATYAYGASADVATGPSVDTAGVVAPAGQLETAISPAALITRHVYDFISSPVAPSAARAAGETSDVLLNSSRQLQRKWKHAADFGVEGNYNPANAARYSEALNQHINSPLTTAIEGTYRGNPVTHHLDPSTGLNVIADSAGNYVSGWRLGPEQLENVLRHGGLN